VTAEPATAAEAARYLNTYARRYSAGAFATPTAAELEKIRAAGGWHWWDGVAAVSRRLTRDSYRTDFTGRRYPLQAGWRVISHLAADPGAELPDLSAFHRVHAYAEDTGVSGQLAAQGREVTAVRVTAASEVIACWGKAGSARPYPPAEAATLVRLPDPGLDLDAARAEVEGLSGWTDDFPFYSDGSWDALSLRGFNPADPAWGIKPAEMSRNWWAEHPEAKAYDRCGWTPLCAWLPVITSWVRSVGWWHGLERVRLLRMQGREGKGGKLSRHTDVTDKAAGVRDGMIARFHIPLITHPDITMTAWNLSGSRRRTHLPPGSMWYLDARKPHAVDNAAGIDRIHLVVDVISSPEVRQHIAAGEDLAA
jgi:hypothetical protein